MFRLSLLVFAVTISCIYAQGKGNSGNNGNSGGNGGGNSGGSGGGNSQGNSGKGEVIGRKKDWKKRENQDWTGKIKNEKEVSKGKGKKPNKEEKKKGQREVVFKGKVQTVGDRETADVDPEPVKRPGKGKQQKSCLNEGSAFPDVTGESKGPKEEGMDPESFNFCSERKRGKGKSSKRAKRSETFAADTYLFDDPSNIPYYIHDSIDSPTRTNIASAIQMWQQWTCLRFSPVTTQPSQAHIRFQATLGACGTLGLGAENKYTAPYNTTIDISSCKTQTGTIAHEIGHALGLTHSQKRTDRDQFVRVFLNNIASNWQGQFTTNDGEFDSWGVPYYYDSIMHYFPLAASTDQDRMTICPLDPLMELVMGQRSEPAFGDIALINRAYCSVSCYYLSEFPNEKFDKESLSQTISGRVCQNWQAQSPHTHGFADYRPDNNHCLNLEAWNGGPWCYTTDANTRYEPCMPYCENLESQNIPFCHGWCHNGGYHDPVTCDCICPPGYTGTDCKSETEESKYAFLPCGGVVYVEPNLPAGFSSPNWPGKYPEDALCMWWLQAPPGYKIRLNVTTFDMESPDSTGCYDYLEIRRDVCEAAVLPSNEIRFCGQMLDPGDGFFPYSHLSDGPDMIVKFYSDKTEVAGGFSVVAIAEP